MDRLLRNIYNRQKYAVQQKRKNVHTLGIYAGDRHHGRRTYSRRHAYFAGALRPINVKSVSVKVMSQNRSDARKLVASRWDHFGK